MLAHLGSPSGILPAGSVSLFQESQGSLGKVHGVQLPAPFLVQGTGPSSSEPPEKERRRLKESFENYRRCGAAGRTA
ncbi:Caspase recruitment domain-containing protein 9 [Cricetulus griseus]|uniref:Caspase recruitment domain-containing protein 9 n=1 Tax=Cricetulus griseus TaxID=10029 RepID=G3I6Y9_CRIGR|nr:Caspase recruitment domain-containing protein 9 [Cricetulus griseus]